MSFFKK
jgi:hypothetical protein